jgi:hypothetical protein
MASLGAELKADLKKQHWDYGYESHGDHMRTTYRDDMVEKKGKQAAMSKEAKDDLRRCHFEYGATPAAESVGGATTMSAHFQGRAGGPSALSKAAQADLRASHFVPGYEQDMAPFMDTTANQLDGQKGPPAKLSAAVKADLRKSHFDVGLHNYKWESLAKSDFTEEARGEGKTADMPAATMKDLRAVHFSYGFVPTGPGEYTTTSRSQSDAYADPRLNKNRNPYGETARFARQFRLRAAPARPATFYLHGLSDFFAQRRGIETLDERATAVSSSVCVCCSIQMNCGWILYRCADPRVATT